MAMIVVSDTSPLSGLALEVKAEELLIDERLGRREAINLGLSITGLLGIWLVGKASGFDSSD
ncbi:hypothetical protein AB3M80_25090 [Arthrospira platensis BEA 1257B]